MPSKYQTRVAPERRVLAHRYPRTIEFGKYVVGHSPLANDARVRAGRHRFFAATFCSVFRGPPHVDFGFCFRLPLQGASADFARFSFLMADSAFWCLVLAGLRRVRALLFSNCSRLQRWLG